MQEPLLTEMRHCDKLTIRFIAIKKNLTQKIFLYKSNNLQNFRLKLLEDFADQRRIVLTTLLPYPGIGESYGSAKTSLINNENIINNPYLLFYKYKEFYSDGYISFLTCVSTHFLRLLSPVPSSMHFPQKLTDTMYSGLGFSHGLPNLSQSSGSSSFKQ